MQNAECRMHNAEWKTRRFSFCILTSALCILHCGCLSVRIVHDAPDGVVVVMPNNSDQWPTYYRNRAEYLMKKKCPDGYVIVHEEEFVDNPAVRDGRKPYEHFEYDGGYERISKYEQKAYRITFRRAAASSGYVVPPKTEKETPTVNDLPPPRRLPEQE